MYNEEMLIVAATVCVVEFEVFRSFDASSAEEHVFKALIAANSQVSGYRQDGQFGIISFSRKAAAVHGVSFDRGGRPRGVGPSSSGFFPACGSSFKRHSQLSIELAFASSEIGSLARLNYGRPDSY